MPKSITERKMNMKKTTKKSPMMKIVSAAAMLAVSASMLATSTYAWFSMNTTVTVTAMQVNVQSNDTFLLIGDNTQNTYSAIQDVTPAQRTVAMTVADGDASVYPSKPKEASEIGTGKLFETGTPVTDYASAATQANWYTANNGNPAASTDSVKNQTSLTSANFSDYVIKKTVYLTLAEGAQDAENLTVTPTISLKSGQTAPTTDIFAVKVLVFTDGNNIVTLDSSMTTAQNLHATANTTLTDTSVVAVDIYIYYDGSESIVTTNDIASLAAADISLQFDVTVK